MASVLASSKARPAIWAAKEPIITNTNMVVIRRAVWVLVVVPVGVCVSGWVGGGGV
jgi:hypothetical protein